jgi:nucleotide-binding universal stress UspA family protein
VSRRPGRPGTYVPRFRGIRALLLPERSCNAGCRTAGRSDDDHQGRPESSQPAHRCRGRRLAEVAARVLSQAVTETVDPAGPAEASNVKVSSMVCEGNAAQVLLQAAHGADLLVVGSRGHGGFAEALLGSVSQHCVHHAQCPIVIVRAGPLMAAGTGEEVR